VSRSRSNSSPRPESINYVRAAMEAVVLVMVAGLPWAFGGVDPIYELLQAAGIALLLVLWATVACVNGRLSWARCPVTIVLAGLFAIGIALFGLYQTFRFGGQTVYGYVTLGEVFGPFINRNHAACFLNLCLGLGIGLLAHAGSDMSEYKRRSVQKPNAVAEQE